MSNMKDDETTAGFRAAMKSSVDGMAILDEDGRFAAMNESHAKVYGYEDPDELIGERWHVCYDDTERECFESTVMPELFETGSWQGEATGMRRDGTTFPQEVTLSALDDGGLICIVRDITDRLTREREVQENELLYRILAENVPDSATFLFDEELRYTLVAGEAFDELDLSISDLEGRTVYEAYPADVLDRIQPHYEAIIDGDERDFDLEFEDRVFHVSLRPVLDEDGTFRTGFGIAEDVTDEVRRERNLKALHNASRRLAYATTTTEVAELTADIGGRVLEKEFSTVWLYDDDRDELALAGTSERTEMFLTEVGFDGKLSPIEEGALGMEVFQGEESTVIDDYGEIDGRAFSSLPLGTLVLVPIDEYGLLVVGEDEVTGIDTEDRYEIELLALNAQAALDRAERESLLVERSEALERQTSQMEFFNSILRHDVLNAMTVIRARAEILAERHSGDDERYAETIVEWCDDIVGIVGRVRTVLETLTGESEPNLRPVDVSTLLKTRTKHVSRAFPEVRFETEIPEDVAVVADDLLADVLGNVITNAVEHNDTENPRVVVSLADHDEFATIRIADNGGGVPDEMKEAVFRRGETGHAKSTGSGFGLFFVDAMVTGYGGQVWVEDSESGGAVFVIELPRAKETSNEQ